MRGMYYKISAAVFLFVFCAVAMSLSVTYATDETATTTSTRSGTAMGNSGPTRTSLPTPAVNNQKTNFDKAVVLIQNQQYADAITLLSTVIVNAPDFADAYVQRGIAYYRTKQSDAALSDFTKALQIDERAFIAYYYRGLIEFKDDHNAANADFMMYVSLARLCASGGIGKQVIEALNELARD